MKVINNIPSRTHIIWRGRKWAIKNEGTKRAYRLIKSKNDAIKLAKSYIKPGYDLVIHNKDGSIDKWEKSPH